MTPAARASAAIEVLADIALRKRPAADALKDWGLAHRFAGSGDRAAIGNVVFDALRRRASSAYAMGDDSPRALVLRTLVSSWGMAPEAMEALADGSRFAPAPLTPQELEGLKRKLPADAPAFIRGDYPEWLDPQLQLSLGAHGRKRGQRSPPARP
jgi:16S rRNA (cytosine967-C5)-methyltransferase